MINLSEQLTPHFTLGELLRSDHATRHGIDNLPGQLELHHLRTITAPGLQRVRTLLQRGVYVSSGYRNAAVNAGVGGSSTSQHMQGLAADFTVPDFGSPLDVCKAIQAAWSTIMFDQLILEGTWTHISFPAPRGEVLTAHFAPGKKTTYTPGLPAG